MIYIETPNVVFVQGLLGCSFKVISGMSKRKTIKCMLCSDVSGYFCHTKMRAKIWDESVVKSFNLNVSVNCECKLHYGHPKSIQ